MKNFGWSCVVYSKVKSSTKTENSVPKKWKGEKNLKTARFVVWSFFVFVEQHGLTKLRHHHHHRHYCLCRIFYLFFLRPFAPLLLLTICSHLYLIWRPKIAVIDNFFQIDSYHIMNTAWFPVLDHVQHSLMHISNFHIFVHRSRTVAFKSCFCEVFDVPGKAEHLMMWVDVSSKEAALTALCGLRNITDVLVIFLVLLWFLHSGVRVGRVQTKYRAEQWMVKCLGQGFNSGTFQSRLLAQSCHFPQSICLLVKTESLPRTEHRSERSVM